MIDPSIITQGAELAQQHQQQNWDRLGNLGQMLGLRTLQNRANQMRQLKTDDERQAFANNSIFAPYLNDMNKSDNASKQKQMYEQLKAEADIAKISSEATKNNAQAGGFTLDNSQKKFGAISGAFQSAAMSGDKGQVLLGLDALQRTGVISPEDYANQYQIVKAMQPDEIKQYASGIGLNNKDVAPYLYQTQNNVADNLTSNNNNIRTTQASIYSTDVGAATADKNRAQQDSQFQQNYALAQQKQYFEQNKPLGFETGSDGYRYAIYPNGKGVRVLGEDGQPIKMQAKQDSGAVTKIAEIQGLNDQAEQTIQNLNRAKQLSNQGIYEGAFSSARADLMGNIGGTQESMRTQQYNNIVMQNALSSLKSIFGGNPTEGEREILLKIQASSSYPAPVREQILNDAIAAAQAKINSNNGQIQTMRGGQNGVQTQQAPMVDSYSFMP